MLGQRGEAIAAIQLTLEQQGFELHRSTYTWILKSISIQSLHTSGFCICRFNQLQLKPVFSICGWEPKDVEDQLCALFYAILYKGLEHPGILVSVGMGWGEVLGLDQSPMDTED